MAEPHRFDRDTAVTPLGDGRYSAACSADWGVPTGPNGGYVAAILARAILTEIDDPARPLRSLSVQFLRPPAFDAELVVSVRIERAGRTVTSVSVRAEQDGRLTALGIALAATDQAPALDYATAPPAVPPAADVPAVVVPREMPPITQRYVLKPCIGPPIFSGGDQALSGGWIRMAEPRAFDTLAAVAYLDAWLPAPFVRLTRPSAAAPTLDYTVHLRAPLPVPGLDPEAFLMARMASTTSAGGFFEADCDIWSPDGVLLGQSRQLALLVPFERPA